MKKLVSLLTAGSMLMLVAVVGAAEITKEQQTDLYSYGIMVGDEKGDLRLNDAITRAEAVKMICCAYNVDVSSNDDFVNYFNDIHENHWAIRYINFAKELGIIDGDEKGDFRPKDEITYNEIIKMIVHILGYSPMAETGDGYPDGYLTVATQVGLTKSLTIENEGVASRNDVAILISNALDIPILIQTGFNFGTEQPKAEYQIANGENGTKLITLRSMLDETK